MAHDTDLCGRYLYAVVEDQAEQELEVSGIDDGKVYTVSDGRLSAVVSDVANKRIRPQRRNIASHNAVLKFLLESKTVLPMAFGVIADGTNAVREILIHNRGPLIEQLERVAGMVEMGLRVVWDVPDFFEYFVSSHAELREVRDRIFAHPSSVGQSDKIELGRLFDFLLNEEREAHTDRVEEILAPLCTEIKRNALRNEQAVMNLACLVERKRIEAFEDGVFSAAALFDNHFVFDYNGPWAPHNFVELNLETRT